MVRHERGRRDLGRRLIGLAIAVLVVALLLLWAWNGAAVELMGAAPAGFRHAVSLAAAIAGVAALTVAAGRLAGARTKRHRAGGQGG
jgi:polyferredoxin